MAALAWLSLDCWIFFAELFRCCPTVLCPTAALLLLWFLSTYQGILGGFCQALVFKGKVFC